MPKTYDQIISQVIKPARYLGGEHNSIVKDWSSTNLKVALAYPDLYDLGMSNLGIALLYDIINKRADALAERIFSPWIDFEQLLRENNEPLRSLETQHSLNNFDILGITLQYEACYTNVLNLLDLGQIPLRSEKRTSQDPLVIAGGSGALQPEPLSPFTGFGINVAVFPNECETI